MNKKMGYGAALVLACAWLTEGALVRGASASETGAQLDEVIVTAQRRVQNLQDVPLAVSAIGEEQLQERGIRDFESYLRTVPGVAFSDLGNQSNEVKLRGVGTGTAQLSPTTAIYFGEVPVIHTGRGLNSSYNFRLVDIARVEVLRGPQGQLYGSNSLGGAIKNIPNRPGLDAFSFSGAAGGSSTREGDENFDGELTLNVPLTESFGLRATGYYAHQGGWYDNVYAGGRALGSLIPNPPIPLFQGTVNGVPVGTPFGGPPWYALEPAIPVLAFPLPAGPPMGPPLRVIPGMVTRDPRIAGYVAPSNFQENVNESEVAGGRLMLRWEASERLTADLMLTYEEKENDGTSWATQVPNVAGSIPGTFVVPRVGGSVSPPVLYTSDATQYQQINPTDAGNTDEILLANLVLDYDFGFATLTSSTSYWDRTEVLETDLGILAFRATGVSGTIPAVVSRDDNPQSFIQELRLTSSDEGRLTWLAGLFYQKLDQDYEVDVVDQSGLDILLTEQTVRNAVNNLPPPVPGPVGLQLGAFEDEQLAVFGELGFDLTPTINAAVSFRWFDLEQTSELRNLGFFFATQGNSLRENSDEVFTPKLNLSWHPTDDLLFYASAAEGFRTGITNRALPLNLCARELANGGFPNGVPPTEADTLWNYELGAKMAFAERRVIVNAAVYHIDWSDLQGQVFLAALKDPSVPVSSCTFETIFNVGDASIDGVELEMSARVTDRLRLDAALAYTDPQYEDDFPQIGIRKGQTIEGTPDLQSFLGLQYDFNVFQRRSFVRVDWTHVGDIEPRGTDFLVQAQPFPIGDFDTLNLRLGTSLTEKVRLDFWVENLSDEFGVTRAIDLAGDGLPTIFTIRPRTAGVTLRWDF